jgi:hypothetical protein
MIDREKGAHEWMIEFKRLQNAFTLKNIRRHLTKPKF